MAANLASKMAVKIEKKMMYCSYTDFIECLISKGTTI